MVDVMTSHRNDLKLAALETQLAKTGSITDLWLEWLQMNGATSGNRMSAEYEFLVSQGIVPADLNGMWYEWLGLQGYTGALADRWHQWAGAGLAAGPRINYGETRDAAGLPSTDKFTIKFPEAVNAANPVTGLSLSGTAGAYIITASSNTATSFTYLINAVWQGDDRPVLRLNNSSGNWTDIDGKPLSTQDYEIVNIYAAPKVLSARIFGIGGAETQIIVDFEIPVTDSGGGNPYTGSALVNKHLNNLPIESVAAGVDNELIYTMTDIIPDGFVEWTGSTGITSTGGGMEISPIGLPLTIEGTGWDWNLLVGNSGVFYGYRDARYIGAPFVFTIDTTLGTGTDDFTLPLRSGYAYNMLVDWGDGASDTITAWNQAEKLHNYGAGGQYQITISGTCEAWYFNDGGDVLKMISVENLGVVGWTGAGLERAFYGCSSMMSFVAGNTDTSAVTDMQNMMRGWSSMTSPPDLSGFDTSAVTNMRTMMMDWPSMTSPPDLSGFGTSACTNMAHMMRNWSSMTSPPDLTSLDTSAVTDMTQMMDNWSSMTSPPDLSGFDTSACTIMSFMMRNWSSMGAVAPGVKDFNITSLTDATDMMQGTTLTTAEYDALLANWAAQTINPNIPMHFGGSQYTIAIAQADRDILTDPPNSAIITDGGGI